MLEISAKIEKDLEMWEYRCSPHLAKKKPKSIWTLDYSLQHFKEGYWIVWAQTFVGMRKNGKNAIITYPIQRIWTCLLRSLESPLPNRLAGLLPKALPIF